jgi:hypothetical protein
VRALRRTRRQHDRARQVAGEQHRELGDEQPRDAERRRIEPGARLPEHVPALAEGIPDPGGGGIEIVDATDVGKPGAEPREVHLVRLAGFSHTHTVDARRPWIVYNSSSDFSGGNWIDVVDIRSCFGSQKWSLATGAAPAGRACTGSCSSPSGRSSATSPRGSVVPSETFCDIHVIEHVPGEQRFIAAYYRQGIKIVDYFEDAQGHVQFRETSSFTLPNANTWAAEDFKIAANPDGTRTYFIAADGIQRGIDVVSWTGPPNPVGSAPPAASSGGGVVDLGLVGLSALLLPAAAALGRRRRRH